MTVRRSLLALLAALPFLPGSCRRAGGGLA